MRSVNRWSLVLLTLWQLVFGSASAAEISIIGNPYQPQAPFLEKYVTNHGLDIVSLSPTRESASRRESRLQQINTIDLPIDSHQGCEQLDYALNWTNAIKIHGTITPSDSQQFRDVLEASKSYSEERSPCGMTIVIDSPGGDLVAAMAIGRELQKKPRFVVVPDGGKCLSACMFILEAARYEDAALRVSKAVAFSNALIAVHGPEILSSDYPNLKAIGALEPGELFRLFGTYWTMINGYSIEMTGSTWLSIALLNSLALPPGQMYVVDSILERKIAGISTILLPGERKEAADSISTSRSICLTFLVGPETSRIADSLNYEFSKDDIYVLYYPVANKICQVKKVGNEFQVFHQTYPIETGQVDVVDGGGYDSPFFRRSSRETVKSFLWSELGKIGLTKDRIGTRTGIGQKIDSIGGVVDWEIFNKLTSDYSCVQCGNSSGVVLFSSRKNECSYRASSVAERSYQGQLRKAGFACETFLFSYLFAKYRFEFEQPEEVGQSLLFNLGANPPIVSLKCQNQSGVCSEKVGVITDNNLVMQSSEIARTIGELK